MVYTAQCVFGALIGWAKLTKLLEDIFDIFWWFMNPAVGIDRSHPIIIADVESASN